MERTISMSAAGSSPNVFDRASSQRASPPRWGVDLVALVIIICFVVWVALGPTGSPFDVAFDSAIFGVVGIAVGAFFLRVSTRVRTRRECLAWRLLGIAALVRSTSGFLWTAWLSAEGSAPRPAWLLGITGSALLLGLAGMLAFTGERRAAADRVRLGIDAAIVAVGSGLVLWFVALGPFFAATGAAAARFEDYVYAVSDTLSAVLAALVFLRSTTRYMRTVSGLLLLAYLLQVIPDVLLWAGKAAFSYRPGDAIDVVWFGVWVLKGAAARYAERALAHPTGRHFVRKTEYESGPVPYLFLVVATGVLLGQLMTAEDNVPLLYVIGAATLSLLLVLREVVEIGERDRLQRKLRAEAAWYGALLRDAFDFVVLLDGEGRALHASPATERLAGGRLVLRRAWGLLDIVHPDDRQPLQQALTAVSDAPTELRARIRASGQDGWRELALRVDDRRADPLVAAVVLNGHDLTVQSLLSERLQQTQELEALGVFAGGLAHDLNNILAVISAHTEMLLDDEPPTPAIGADLRAVMHAAARARHLTRGLLTLSREKAATDNAVDVLSVLRARIVAARVGERVRVRTDLGALTARVDVAAIELAFDALLLTTMDSLPQNAVVEIRMEITVADAAAAEALGVAPGRFITLAVRTLLHPDVTSVPVGIRPWAGSSEDLAMLMALAAVRETGGTIVTPSDDDAPLTMYIPTEVGA